MARQPSALTVTDRLCGAGGSGIGAAHGFRLRVAMNKWRVALLTALTLAGLTRPEPCPRAAKRPASSAQRRVRHKRPAALPGARRGSRYPTPLRTPESPCSTATLSPTPLTRLGSRRLATRLRRPPGRRHGTRDRRGARVAMIGVWIVTPRHTLLAAPALFIAGPGSPGGAVLATSDSSEPATRPPRIVIDGPDPIGALDARLVRRWYRSH